MASSKVILVVDVSCEKLVLCVDVLQKFVQQKMYNTPNNLIALILAGTAGTDVSQINGNKSKFGNITVKRPLIHGDIELLKIIQDIPKHSEAATKINLVDALEAAMRLFNQETTKTHWMSENRIMLFTDGNGSFHGDVEFVTKEMNLLKPQLVFKLIGPRLYDDDTATQTLHQGLSPNSQRMSDFCNSLENGENLGIEDALHVTEVFKKRRVRQTTTFKGCLEIGSSLNLPVYIYSKVRPNPPEALKMCDNEGGTVVRDRVYHLEDENQTEVDKDSINKGYRYGKSYIPISKVDESLMKNQTNKQLKLICTTKRSNIRKEELITTTAYSVTAPSGDAFGSRALATFATALQEQGLVAVCRYVNKDDSNVKLCCLVPNVKELCAVLMLVELPFANDIRKADFPRIKAKVSDDQLSAVDKLIDSMDLSKSGDNVKPSEISNPNIQRRYDCVVHRALYPKLPLPEADLVNYLKLPKLDSESSIEECQHVFGITKIVKRPKRTADDMFTETPVLTNELKKVKKEDISMDDLLGTEVKVSTTNTLKDFARARTKLGAKDACEQLISVIKVLVQHGADPARISECLACLRGCSVEDQLYDLFNVFLRGVKSSEVVLGVCKKERISLIHSGECKGSTVSASESDQFLSEGELEGVEEMLADEDDDLLDMI